MNDQIAPARELQRNYKGLINRVKKTKQPIYLGAHLQKEAVLVDIESFERWQRLDEQNRAKWKEVKKTLEQIRKSGKQGVNLAKFIHDDRRRH